jgi:hypothetical protein
MEKIKLGKRLSAGAPDVMPAKTEAQLMADKGHLTVNETARVLGVSRAAVYKRMLGGLAFVAIGRHRYVAVKELARWVGKDAAKLLGIETKRP